MTDVTEGPVRYIVDNARIALKVLGIVACVAVPFVISSSYWVEIILEAGVYIIAGIGLNLVTGYGGQFLLGQAALMAVGGYVFGILQVDHAWSFWPAALLGVVASVVIAIILGIPSLRMGTAYFAIITLIFATVVYQLSQTLSITGGDAGIIGTSGPKFGNSSFTTRDFYWLVLACVVVGIIVTRHLLKSKYGRALMGVRENGLACQASGASPTTVKMKVFAISGGFAGVAGVILAAQQGLVVPGNYSVNLSVYLFVIVVLGGAGYVWGPVVGGLVFFAVPELLQSLQSYQFIIYGVVLLLLVVAAPTGLVGAVEHLGLFKYGRKARVNQSAGSDSREVPLSYQGNSVVVKIEDVTKSFGGNVALQDVSLRIEKNEVHGIVGANGSGKTTLLNLISGYYNVDSGVIWIGDHNIGREPADRVARCGVGRTFQTPRLIPDLSGIENVQLGRFTKERTAIAEVLLRTRRARKIEIFSRESAAWWLRFVGLEHLGETLTGSIPHGQQRLIEIARALAAEPGVLLLDEPAAGLSLGELEGLSELLRRIKQLGVTVVLVEHHMDFIVNLCDRITLLDQGRVQQTGTVADIRQSGVMNEIFMGRSAVL